MTPDDWMVAFFACLLGYAAGSLHAQSAWEAQVRSMGAVLVKYQGAGSASSDYGVAEFVVMPKSNGVRDVAK